MILTFLSRQRSYKTIRNRIHTFLLLKELIYINHKVMFDVALSSAGAQIALSTSSDDNHPPENMIDGLDGTFWTTTGLYPQEVVIRFQALMTINSVQISSCCVKDLILETSENENADTFEPLTEKELDKNGNQMQNEEFKVRDRRAYCLRLLINSGYDHFVAVFKIRVNGRALHG